MRLPFRYASACLVLAVWAGMLHGQDEVEKALKDLDSADAAQRAAAETALRNLGEKALPALRTAKIANEEGQVRMRTVLMDLSVKHAKIDATEADTLMQLAREEALAKRYANAEKGYDRAQGLYEKLEDDADDRKEKEKQKEFDEKKDRAHKLKEKAERLAKGQEHKVSHWGPIPTIKKVEDDGDW
ncbi:MAG: hypothetical protein HS116_24625 [Planctomycetes bacterium]|nr:hypothetical protein [Planctomycetota bacterium]